MATFLPVWRCSPCLVLLRERVPNGSNPKRLQEVKSRVATTHLKSLWTFIWILDHLQPKKHEFNNIFENFPTTIDFILFFPLNFYPQTFVFSLIQGADPVATQPKKPTKKPTNKTTKIARNPWASGTAETFGFQKVALIQPCSVPSEWTSKTTGTSTTRLEGWWRFLVWLVQPGFQVGGMIQVVKQIPVKHDSWKKTNKTKRATFWGRKICCLD